jgi:transporter family-2 protein
MLAMFLMIAFFVGTLLPWQPVINSRLGFELSSPLWSSFISFLVGALVLGVVVIAQGQLSERLQKLVTLPPWMFAGGVFGIIFVSASLLLIPKIGATSLTAAFVCGQLMMSLAMDHFGLAGLPHRPLDLSRMLGVALLLAGLFLVVRPGHAP